MNREEQIKILQMVADGIVSIEEGEDLLDALEHDTSIDAKPAMQANETISSNGKWLHYQVVDEESGVESVNLRLPSGIFSGLFTRKENTSRRMSDTKSSGTGEEKPTERKGMFLNILGENDGKRFKLYFE